MIRGVVNSRYEAIVRIRVRGSGDLQLDVPGIGLSADRLRFRLVQLAEIGLAGPAKAG